MKRFKSLIIIDKFRWLFEKMNIDYDAMRKILEIKITMDERRVTTIYIDKEDDGKKHKNKFKQSLTMYVIMSVFLSLLIFFKMNTLFKMNFFFGLVIFLIMTTMISDFSSVLLDIRDKSILSIRPISTNTLNMAKILHIGIYIGSITLALTAIPLGVAMILWGFKFFLMLLCEIVLVDLFVISLTAIIYIFVLKFFDGEKLKDLINCVQIILTLFMTILYQFMDKLFYFINTKINFLPRWWQYFIPSMWFASPFELFIEGNKQINILILSVLALVIPILFITLYIKLIPVFELNIEKLNNINSIKKRRSLLEMLQSVICRNNEEKAFFKFILTMTKNERDFKLKIYPSMGIDILIPLIFMVKTLTQSVSVNQWLLDMRQSNNYLFIYFIAISGTSIMNMLTYSKQYKGGWIYKVCPITNVENIFKAVIKIVILKFILPIFLIESLILILIFTPKIVIHLLIVFINTIIITLISFKLYTKGYPFSKYMPIGESLNLFETISVIIILFVLGSIHYKIIKLQCFEYAFLGILIFICIVMWKICLRFNCDEIK